MCDGFCLLVGVCCSLCAAVCCCLLFVVVCGWLFVFGVVRCALLFVAC